MINCPSCSREVSESAKICPYCGSPLIDINEVVATRALGDTDFEENVPKWGSARYTSRINLNILVDGEEKTLTIDTEEMDQMMIGRLDPNTNETPPIDLSDFGAVDKGVSRRHAYLMRKDGALHIVDLGSPNGTYLNGQRLVTEQPRVVRDGDDIRLGYLVVRVSFERS